MSNGSNDPGRLGELLVREKLITPLQLQKAAEEQRSGGGRLGYQLTKMGFIEENELTAFLSKQYGIPSINLYEFDIEPDIIKLIPKERASEFHAAITSYRRLIGLVTPFIAGALASVYATLPYAASLVLFLMMGGLFMKVRQESKDDESPKNKNSQH